MATMEGTSESLESMEELPGDLASFGNGSSFGIGGGAPAGYGAGAADGVAAATAGASGPQQHPWLP